MIFQMLDSDTDTKATIDFINALTVLQVHVQGESTRY